jgi:hypothetical protein
MRKMIATLFVGLVLAGPAFGHGMSEADKIRAAGGGIVEFLRQGAVHMVTGYDHLLFLFGVVFFLSKFKDIVKFVTAFTLGHCITLIGATFLGIQANYFLVDAVIALTVCYKGFDNVGGFEKFLGMKSPNLLGMVFAFGLIHGFGLSTRLQTLTIGEGWDLLGKILAFNVGVEAGQVAALVVILGLLAAWRHTESFQRFSLAANTGLIIVGGMLLMMQLHGYSHQGDPMAVGNLAKHMDAHEDLRMADVGTLIPAGQHVDSPGGTPHADHADHGAPAAIPAGFHVDSPGGTPHADHADHDAGPKVPEGFHVDSPGGTPHADHADHGKAESYNAVIDRIFETRKGIKSAKTDAEVLEVHHPVSEIHKDLVTLRSMVATFKVDHALYDVWLKDATAAAKLIAQEAHEGNAAKTRELIARFDKGVLAIEDLINHPAAPGTPSELPEGYHVDGGDSTPHKDHDH